MKHWLKAIFIFALIVIGLAACTSLGEGETTREIGADGMGTAVPPTSLPNTPTPTATSTPTVTPTRTLIPTDVPIPTSFATATWTPEPSPTPWPSATPRPTIDFSTGVVWSEATHLTHQFPGYRVEWSPARSDFVYIVEGEEGLDAINLAGLPNFQSIDIMPTEMAAYSVGFLWHPSGDYFFLSAEPSDIETFGWGIHSWKVEPTNPDLTYLGLGSYYWDWLNDELRISQRRIGTGWNSIGIFNIITEQVVGHTDFG